MSPALDASPLIEHLTFIPSAEAALAGLPPAAADWLRTTFGEPTPVQRAAWPAIRAGHHLLVSAPTGTGKTLAALVPLFADLPSELPDGLLGIVVTPLKALVQD